MQSTCPYPPPNPPEYYTVEILYQLISLKWFWILYNKYERCGSCWSIRLHVLFYAEMFEMMEEIILLGIRNVSYKFLHSLSKTIKTNNDTSQVCKKSCKVIERWFSRSSNNTSTSTSLSDNRPNNKLHISNVRERKRDCIVCSGRKIPGWREKATFYCETCTNKPAMHIGIMLRNWPYILYKIIRNEFKIFVFCKYVFFNVHIKYI